MNCSHSAYTDKPSYPSWTLKVQIATPKQAEQIWKEQGINVFDLTHIWPHKEFPLRTVGKFTLNQNPKVSNHSVGELKC